MVKTLNKNLTESTVKITSQVKNTYFLITDCIIAKLVIMSYEALKVI